MSAVDCAQGTGNLGCNGGNMDVTFSWILNNGGGVNTQASYPWTGVQGTCRYNSRNNGATIKSYRRAAAGSEAGLLSLAANGPVAVGINSSPRTFLYYRSGTLSDSSCTASGINHAVAVVGWGTDSNGQAYWLIKNSWGTCTSSPSSSIGSISLTELSSSISLGSKRLRHDRQEQRQHVRHRFHGLSALLHRQLCLSSCLAVYIESVLPAWTNLSSAFRVDLSVDINNTFFRL